MIAITEDTRKELEDKSKNYEIVINNSKININKDFKNGFLAGRQDLLTEILSKAIVLPVAENWNKIGEDVGTLWEDDAEIMNNEFPNGVIINQKQ